MEHIQGRVNRARERGDRMESSKHLLDVFVAAKGASVIEGALAHQLRSEPLNPLVLGP